MNNITLNMYLLVDALNVSWFYYAKIICLFLILVYSLNSRFYYFIFLSTIIFFQRVRRGRDRMVFGFTTACAISAYHHRSCEFESHSGVLYATLCDNVCQWLAAGCWFYPGTPVSFTNKTDRHDITEIVVKVALNTINQPYF
jgi:hypothetical protein